MASLDKQDLIELFENARRLYYPNQFELKEAFRYTEPARDIENTNENMAIRRQWLYDSTAIDSVNQLQTNISQLLVPSSEKWAEISFLDEVQERKWQSLYARNLELANTQLFEFFARSNFYQAFAESNKDCIIGGTACLMVINRTGYPVSFMPIPLNELFFTEDFNGRVDNVFRLHHKTKAQIKKQFGQDVYLPDGEMDENDKRYDLVEVDYQDPVTLEYEYNIYLKSNWEPLQEAKKSKFKTFHVWRWAKNLSNPWGESPIRHALPTIRTLNVMIQSMLTFGEYAAFGLWQSQGESTNEDNLRSSLVPGSIIFTEEEIKPLVFPGNMNISTQMISDTRQQVRDMLLNKPQRDPNKTPITAEQVTDDRDTFYKMIGEPARRLQDEVLQPVCEHVFGILLDRGELNLVTRDQLKSIDAAAKHITDVFQVETTAAITKVLQVQEAQQDIQAYQVALQTFGPQLINKWVDQDKLLVDTLTNLGFSLPYIRSAKEAAQVEQQMQQQAVMQQGSEQAADFAKTAVKTPAGNQILGSILNNGASSIHNTPQVVGQTQNLLAS